MSFFEPGVQLCFFPIAACAPEVCQRPSWQFTQLQEFFKKFLFDHKTKNNQHYARFKKGTDYNIKKNNHLTVKDGDCWGGWESLFGLALLPHGLDHFQLSSDIILKKWGNSI